MTQGFRATRTGVAITLSRLEVDVLGSLVQQLVTLLSEDDEPAPDADPLEAIVGLSSGSRELSDDPVLARLFPDAYADDPTAAGEYRRFTESELRQGKLGHARAVLESLPQHGGTVKVAAADVEPWLGLLNDLRLALGTRLGVTEEEELADDLADDDAPADDDDPRRAGLDLYHWLTYLQGTLLEQLLG